MGMEDLEAPRSWYLMSDNMRGHTLFVTLLLLVFFIFLLLSFIFFRFICHQVKFPSFAPTYDHDQMSSTNFNTDHRIININLMPAAPAVALGLDAEIIKSLPILIHRTGRGWACSASEDDDDDDTTNTSSETSSSNKRSWSFGGDQSDCSICLGRFEDKEMVKVMPDCLHAFHSECVDKWLSSRSTCPLCRASLDTSSSTSTGSVIA